jgi:hypothetical protein
MCCRFYSLKNQVCAFFRLQSEGYKVFNQEEKKEEQTGERQDRILDLSFG